MSISSFKYSADLPINIVGSTKFGIYPKISKEETWNMFVSDGWFLNFSGYKKVIDIISEGRGRGLFASSKFNHMIAVINSGVYLINDSITAELVENLDTFANDVYIDESSNGEIAICDLRNIYIYNQVNGDFYKPVLNFVPGYIAFQDSRFISIDRNNPEWRLSDRDEDGKVIFPDGTNFVGEFQTTADVLTAVVPVPGKSNSLFVVGENIIENWVDVGFQLFPYQKNNTFSIPYGAIPNTIAKGNQIVAMVGLNNNSGISIMYTTGGDVEIISTDGINYQLEQLQNPNDSYGFLFMQNGHLFYVATFTTDNFSIAYDFTEKKFYNLSDENQNYFIAKNVVYFENTYYFLSFKDGNLYELNTNYGTYDGNEIPRIRIPETIRLPKNDRFVMNVFQMTIESGYSNETTAVDLSISKDGGQSFSNTIRKEIGKIPNRANMFRQWNLGSANEAILQFRFWGLDRFVINNGYMSVYQ